ncbi:hypothetical protein FBF75_05215 [Bacillus sp. S2(2019)]|uniref:hypothetical protein n=1 Tax=Bacillus TaxID=1386 RepID=UPI0010ADB7C1|nr:MULTISPECIES: hypothetical protein [unclassified Bacillus (in: firmicutes)]TKD57961.1 hypothetical protein FBF75_05215 [Bacillus sp. S2(2019)]
MIEAYEYNQQNELIRPIEVFERDDDGNYIIPEQCTTIAPPNNPSFYKAAFDVKKQQWYESATQEYKDSLKPAPLPPSDIELLKKQNALLSKQLTQLLAMQKVGASD